MTIELNENGSEDYVFEIHADSLISFFFLFFLLTDLYPTNAEI